MKSLNDMFVPPDERVDDFIAMLGTSLVDALYPNFVSISDLVYVETSAADNVILAVPSKGLPLIVRAVRNYVAVAAFPDVLWFPAVLTPGRLMFALPSKGTPPIVRAVFSFVAVAALPVVSWLPMAFTPGRLILAVPLNETPPIVLAVCNFVADAAFPVVFWLPVAFTPGILSLDV